MNGGASLAGDVAEDRAVTRVECLLAAPRPGDQHPDGAALVGERPPLGSGIIGGGRISEGRQH